MSATTAEPPTPVARKSSTSGAAGSSVRASRATSPNSIVNKYASPASTTSYYAQQQAAAQEASPDSDFSSSDDSSSDTSSDEDDEGPEVVVGDDGYEYEYYDDEDETPALAPVNTGPTSILRKPAAATSSPYSSAYGASAEAPSRNTSAYGSSTTQAGSSSYGSSSGYGASTSAYGSSRQAEPEAPRPTRAYSGARTTGAYGGYEEPSSSAAPLSPTSGRRSSQFGRYTSPAPEPSSSVLTERRFSREDSSDSGASRYATRKRDDSDSFVSRYLAKSRTSGALTAEQKEPTPDESATRKISGELQYPSGRSRYAALKERKARLAKSKSSAALGLGNNDEDDDDDSGEVLTPFTSRFGGELAHSRSSHMLKDQSSPSGSSRQPEPSNDDENLSSWAKYLKNKYGGRAATNTSAQSGASRESEDRRSRLGMN